jgi:hypothetical protein
VKKWHGTGEKWHGMGEKWHSAGFFGTAQLVYIDIFKQFQQQICFSRKQHGQFYAPSFFRPVNINEVCAYKVFCMRNTSIHHVYRSVIQYGVF